jgi:RimJ/RimL family protein N-acetyltransferase
MQLENSLVRLRRYRKSDVPVVLELVNDAEIRECLMPGIALPYSLEEEDKWFETHAKEPKVKFSFAIERKSDNAYLGGCGWNDIDWKNRRAVVGIFLAREYCGQGLGTSAMSVLVDFLFKEMNINKVALHVYSFNKRAIRSYEKLGFKTEGVRRAELFRKGEFHDIVDMGLLSSEWEATKRI